MDEATWAALAAALTVAGLIWTWVAFRRRGTANAMRALGFTLLPAAAWLTGTLEMLTEITGSVADWATSLVLDPRTWTGIGLAGLALVLWVVSGFLRDRQLARGQSASGADAPPRRSGRRTGELPAAKQPKGAPALDDDMADIEAMLRKRGIS